MSEESEAGGVDDAAGFSPRRVLVTRPAADAAPLAQAITARGGEPLCEPLLDIDFINQSVDLTGVAALVFTSANGVRAFARNAGRRDFPVYAVGGVTAQTARNAGFTHVSAAGGDVASLVALLRDNVDPSQGRLLHVAGRHVAGDLQGLLTADGFDVTRAVLYHATAAERLSPAARMLLRHGDGVHNGATVVLYSPRTARIFLELALREGLAAAMGNCAALCLAPAVMRAAVAGGKGAGGYWGMSAVAAAPDPSALLEALEQLWQKKQKMTP